MSTISEKTTVYQANDSSFPRELEDEAIYILREVASQFEKPAILFSVMYFKTSS